VLRHSGSVVEDCGDHLVVRTPQNPDYHWGNCILGLDERSGSDAERWSVGFAPDVCNARAYRAPAR
jgi:hypothetical protein